MNPKTRRAFLRRVAGIATAVMIVCVAVILWERAHALVRAGIPVRYAESTLGLGVVADAAKRAETYLYCVGGAWLVIMVCVAIAWIRIPTTERRKQQTAFSDGE